MNTNKIEEYAIIITSIETINKLDVHLAIDWYGALNPFTAMGHFYKQPPWWPTFLAMLFQIQKGWVFHCKTNSKCDTTWSKSNVIQTYGGRKLRFRAVWKRKRPAPSLLVFRLRRHSSKVLQAYRLNTRSNDGAGMMWEYFFWPSRVFQVYDRYLPTLWRSAPALKFSSQLTRNVSLATILVHSYRRSLDEDERSLVGTSRSSFTAILQAVWSFFSTADPSLVSLPANLRRHSLRAFNRTKPLSLWLLSSRKPSNVQLVPARVTSGNIHNAVSRHLDKNRGKQRRTVFSMNKTQESKQRSTNWRRRQKKKTSETCNNNQVDGRALTKA